MKLGVHCSKKIKNKEATHTSESYVPNLEPTYNAKSAQETGEYKAGRKKGRKRNRKKEMRGSRKRIKTGRIDIALNKVEWRSRGSGSADRVRVRRLL